MSTKSPRPRKGIPRHEAYQCGIAPAAYDLEHLFLAFGGTNVRAMLDAIERGEIELVRRMLRKWTLHRYGDKYSMIDQMCDTETAYGLTPRTAARNGASTEIVE